jgi:hypothetical protein
MSHSEFLCKGRELPPVHYCSSLRGRVESVVKANSGNLYCIPETISLHPPHCKVTARRLLHRSFTTKDAVSFVHWYIRLNTLLAMTNRMSVVVNNTFRMNRDEQLL